MLFYSELVIDGGMLTEHDTLWLVPAEIKIFSVENLELSMVVLLKHGVGQTIATHASPAARKASLSISTFPVRSVSFVSNPLSTFSLR